MSRFKGIRTLASGTVLAQLITVAATPLLTRLYSPNAFAALALVVSAANTLGVFAHGRLTVAIAASDNDESAEEIFATGRRLVWLVCLVSFVGLLSAHALGAAPKYTVGIIAAACLLGGVTATLDLHAFFRNASKAYRVSATASVIRAAATVVLQALFSLVGAFGQIAGAVAGAVASLWYSQKVLGSIGSAKQYPLTIDWTAARLRQHKNYILYSAPQALANALGNNLPPVILSAVSNPEFVGQYWLAYRLLIAPISILGGSYRQASISAFLPGKSRILRTLLRDSAALAGIVILIAIFLMAFGGTAFAIAFGERWREAGLIASVLVLGYGADLAKVPAVCLLQARRMERLLLMTELVTVGAKLGALSIGLMKLSPLSSLVIFAVAGALGALALMGLGLRIALFSRNTA